MHILLANQLSIRRYRLHFFSFSSRHKSFYTGFRYVNILISSGEREMWKVKGDEEGEGGLLVPL